MGQPSGQPFFGISLEAARREVTLRFPHAVERESTMPGDEPGYILFLCTQIASQRRDTMSGAVFASWHTGRMLALCEALGLWEKETSYELLSRDVRNKNHLPKSR